MPIADEDTGFALTLGGETWRLEFSPRVLSRMDRHFGSMRDAHQQMERRSVAAVGAVVQIGTSASDNQTKRINDLIYRAGVARLVTPLREYLWRLENGGMTLDELAKALEEQAETDADTEGDTGNG